ncbi:HK97 family phage prohead protease [Novosphingobium sp. KCTC 2891]|uniref:HK97 family phage prohead protease n=1 Tax=Novosphingobium sp. KCTC 2891 TaxID=2989730 RepID=UPI0022237B95|nr:HK97 family phage prohead protease [Novosphingobium sp. KCTC 2891]MCW1383208.1 HK97 family phage prohead protease [Novosphingobium sp. KCTC 2891]
MSTLPLRFAGYAAVFGKRDSGGDTIVPGAFAATLAARRETGARLPLYWQHRPDQQIGWIERAEEDARGLRVVAQLSAPDSPAARALARGAVTGLSFGYRVREGQMRPGGRELRAVDLFEVSLVSRPMQPLARVHMVDPAND